MIFANSDLKLKKEISFPVKLYFWSLATEPLMFFVLTDVQKTGSALTLSRLLQIGVIIYFILHSLRNASPILDPFYKYYNSYVGYIFVGFVSSLFGLFFFDNYTIVNSVDAATVKSDLTEIFKSHNTRPFLEVILLLYYFIYFFVVPRYLITSKEHLLYLLNLLIKIFKIGIAIGFLDILNYLITGKNVIARHLIDSEFVQLATRFHGFAGEPRDAFPYLIFGFAIYSLKVSLFENSSPSKYAIVLLIFLLILTQSASGLIGVGISLVLFTFLEMKLSFGRIIQSLFIVLIGLIILSLVAEYTERIAEYVSVSVGIYAVLKTGEELHPFLFSQGTNIFPIWQFWLHLMEFKIIPVLLGSGLGSVSVVNNNFMNANEILNPNSNLIRILYEVGLLGLWLYLRSQLRPIRDLSFLLGNMRGRQIFLYGIFLIGACLGHRSSTIFIFCGIVLACIQLQVKEK